MKISEFNTEQATDILCEMTPCVMNILTDEDLMEELKKAIKADQYQTYAEKIAVGISKITRIIPIVLKKRRADVYGILAILNNSSVEEIAMQNFIKTMSQIKDILKDKELLAFFKSCTYTEGGE